MFDTPVINVAIGLVFCFAAMSLAASTVTEALASLVKLRANTLVTGVQAMLNDPKFSGLARQVYEHALVHPQGSGSMNSSSRWWTYTGPSYIKAENFATALTDVLAAAPGKFVELKAGIDAIPDPQIQQLLQGMYARADNDLAAFQKQVADWFDTAMDRVSGAYKRQAQLACFIVGLALAVTMNVDATHITATLWANPEVARSFAARMDSQQAATADLQGTLTRLEQLPVGPERLAPCTPAASAPTQGYGSALFCVQDKGVTTYNLLGWLITAVASVFGAPFWFDMLSKLVQLRGSGPKPDAAKQP